MYSPSSPASVCGCSGTMAPTASSSRRRLIPPPDTGSLLRPGTGGTARHPVARCRFPGPRHPADSRFLEEHGRRHHTDPGTTPCDPRGHRGRRSTVARPRSPRPAGERRPGSGHPDRVPGHGRHQPARGAARLQPRASPVGTTPRPDGRGIGACAAGRCRRSPLPRRRVPRITDRRGDLRAGVRGANRRNR